MEAENRRDRGIDVTKINNEELLKLYPRIYSSIVWLVRRHKLDAIPDPRLDNDARSVARGRIVRTDLMEILECAFAFTHIPVMDNETESEKHKRMLGLKREDIKERHVEYGEKESEEEADVNAAPNISLYREQKSRLMRRWKLSYTDKNDGTRVYMCHWKGLMQFAEDYKWHYHKTNIIVKNELISDALDKLTIEVSESLHYRWIEMDSKTTMKAVMFRETIRGRYFKVEAGDIAAVTSKAVAYLKDHEKFIFETQKDGRFF